MDYHRDRFTDHSLMAFRDGDLLALLPANQQDELLCSHQGLSYGGFVVDARMTVETMLALFDGLIAYMRGMGLHRLLYKTIPHIYHRVPAEADRYALFRIDAGLYRRDVLAVLGREGRPPRQTRRRRGAQKAQERGVVVARSDHWDMYWEVLAGRLAQRYEASPVHTLEEIYRLHSAFPDNIALYTAERSGDVLGGTVIFESSQVAHVQYIAASDSGRECGALDLLFEHLLEHVYAMKPFLDFGNSNEREGRYLNSGVMAFKEGFGARAVAHDFYELPV